MDQYGLFSDEGLVEDGFYSLESANAALAKADPDDGLEVLLICPDHEDQPERYCEHCMGEDEEDEEDEVDSE